MRYFWILFAGTVLGSLLMFTLAHADPRTDCPTAGKPCKVLVLTEEEQNVLVGDKGILQTAAAARSLDLGGLTTYFQQKIATAPGGDVKEAPKPAAVFEKPVEPGAK